MDLGFRYSLADPLCCKSFGVAHAELQDKGVSNYQAPTLKPKSCRALGVDSRSDV